jgi:hypothetical protein
MTKRCIFSAVVCLGVLLAQSAHAHSLRPHWNFAKHSHKNGKCCAPDTPSSQPTLQQILDGVVSGPAIDANSPSGIELWDNSSGPMTAQIVADYTGKKDRVFFGMYSADDPTNRAFLLADFLRPTDIATVSFLEDGLITIRGGLTHRKKEAGFDGPFGFFVKVAPKHEERVFLFTEADLNGGNVQAKVFQGDGQTVLDLPCLSPGLFLPSQFLIAFETDGDNRFDDLLVLVSGVVAHVPEPGVAWLLGVSLAALLARRVRST